MSRSLVYPILLTSVVCGCSGGAGRVLTQFGGEASAADCPGGGILLQIGTDANHNDRLEGQEIEETHPVCDGENAVAYDSLISISEAPLSECPHGGQQLDVGTDDGGNGGTADDGVLQPGEIDETRFVCNGAPGADGVDGTDGMNGNDGMNGEAGPAGYAALVVVSQATTVDCPDGGIQIDVGLDNGDGGATPDDGVLQPGEVDDTGFVCDGAPGSTGSTGTSGFSSFVTVSDAPAGACPNGGKQIETGLDNGDGGGTAGDGILQAGEVDDTQYVCNGLDGGLCELAPGALAFDGVDDHVRTVGWSYTGPLTIEAWFKPSLANGVHSIVGSACGGDDHLWIGDTPGDRQLLFGPGGGMSLASGVERISLNEWHHAAGVSDGSEMRLYLDGRLVGQDPSGGTTWFCPSGFMFGNNDNGLNRPFVGWIAEVRISDMVRYTTEFTPPPSLLADANAIGLWWFREGSGQVVADESGNSRDGQLGATSGTDSSDPEWSVSCP